MDKATIKREIEKATKDILYSSKGDQELPTVFTFFLGSNTYNEVNASLNDAFTSCFSIIPNHYECCLQGNEDPLDIEDAIYDHLKEIGKKEIDKNVFFQFIALMHDEINQDRFISLIDIIREAFSQDGDLYYARDNISFYGILDQLKRRDYFYDCAYKFINEGKDIWKKIFHIEKRRTIDNYFDIANLIVINTLINPERSDDNIWQQNQENEYEWMSLSLNSLRVPEYILTRILSGIYKHQLSSKDTDDLMFKAHIEADLDQLLIDHFSYADLKCYQYVPLSIPSEQQKKGLFSFKSKKDERPVYSNILINEDEIPSIVNELIENNKQSKIDYLDFITRVICNSTQLNQNSVQLSNIITSVLDKKKMELSNTKIEEINLNRLPTDNPVKQLQLLFDKDIEKKVNQLKIKAIDEISNAVNNEATLNNILRTIIANNELYVKYLNELCINEYGGKVDESVDIHHKADFIVNESVEKIITKIGYNNLQQKMTLQNSNGEIDIESILDKLDSFLLKINDPNAISHSIGSINDKYSELKAVEYDVILSDNVSYVKEVDDKIFQFGNFHNINYRFARDHTFYVISRRYYCSDYYITRYKRKEEK